MELRDALDLLMFAALCGFLLAGFPVALTLAGTGLTFAFIGYQVGVFDLAFLSALPSRIFGTTQNESLIAVPLFIFMGVMLEKSRVAEDLLESMGRLFGPLPGGLGLSVMVVGALVAASTGIVGATVVTMGLLSLPTMLRRGYDPALSAGAISAAGTLGQIIPPSIVLVLLGDQISSAFQQAQLAENNFSPETVTVGDLFAGALIPGLTLVALYILYVMGVAILSPKSAPPMPRAEAGENVLGDALRALVAPIVLIVAVLGSILTGIATPTEAASLGALGALLLAGQRLSPAIGGLRGLPIIAAGIAVIVLIALARNLDMRLGRADFTVAESAAAWTAIFMTAIIAFAAGLSLWRTVRADVLVAVMDQTLQVTAMVFLILIGAAVFSIVFRGLGGDDTIHEFLSSLPGGATGAIIAVMVVMFVLGFFIDFIEIIFIVVPIVAPVLLTMGIDPIWLGVLMAINLQTSFLTPPFGFALFYLRGVAPPEVTTWAIYRGVLPFIAIQIVMLLLLALVPELATWLPSVMFD